MSVDGKWKDLDDRQLVLLSEGFCPWGAQCRLGSAKVLRNGELVEYGHCLLNDALVRVAAGKPEVLPLEAVVEKGWRLVECQT